MRNNNNYRIKNDYKKIWIEREYWLFAYTDKSKD
jgi:hypothetical protein